LSSLGVRPRTFPPVFAEALKMELVRGWKTTVYWRVGILFKGAKMVSVILCTVANRAALFPKVTVPNAWLEVSRIVRRLLPMVLTG
jgi:hypothetical protein